MYKFIVVLVVVGMAAASPMSSEAAARRALPALLHEEVHDQYGQFALRYVTAEGTVVWQRGRLVLNNNHTGYMLFIDGSTTYIGDDGKTYITKYSASPYGTKSTYNL